MSTETFEKILLHQDDAALNEVVSDLSQFDPDLQKLILAYNNLQLEGKPFDSSIFDWIKNGGNIQQILDVFFKQVGDSMTETGVLYERLRTMLLEDAQKPDQDFRDAVSALRNFTPKNPTAKSVMHEARSVLLSLEHISYNDESNEFYVSEHSRNIICEQHFRLYIDNEREKEIYDVVSALRQPLINYYLMLKSNGVPPNITQGYIPTTFLSNFFQFELGTSKADIKPYGIKWASSFKK